MDNNGRQEKMADKTTIYAVCAIVLGAALILSPYGLMRIAAYAAGAVLVALGGTALVSALRDQDGSNTAYVIAAAIAVLIGISTFVTPYGFIAMLPTAAGFVLVVYGAKKVKDMSGNTLNTIMWGKAWPYIASAALGIILLLNPFSAAVIGAKAAGAALIIYGAIELAGKRNR